MTVSARLSAPDSSVLTGFAVCCANCWSKGNSRLFCIRIVEKPIAEKIIRNLESSTRVQKNVETTHSERMQGKRVNHILMFRFLFERSGVRKF